jgi:hypothetical protein
MTTTARLESWSRRANGTLMARTGNYGVFESGAQIRPAFLTWVFAVERVTRIELALSAWEADVLPLNYTRAHLR